MSPHLVRFTVLAALTASSVMGAGHNNSSLRGKVEAPSSRPLPQAVVTLTSLERSLHTQTGSDGSFEFSDIPENTYEIEIRAPGFARQKLSLDLRAESSMPPLEIVLHLGSIPDMETCGPHSVVSYGPVVESSHRLTGSIRTYDHNKPVARADVTLRRIGEDNSLHATTGKDGKYVFEDLPAGRYELRISRRGYASQDVKQLVVPRSNEVFINTTILGGRGLVICQ